ncbi:MAG: hypothetical protein CML42_05380 [Rhodobacteraceae bacterium]|jgi:hypothetical protein|nr:hypothetical protein [Paracoccaceae bacterium]|tara:strand:- start:21405 stop:21851 length:447 start_codon:yes stop_codon:yes gene_type:complete
MIKYTLECRKKHRFESWFKSADAFEKLLTSGHITCSVCGISEVSKSIMAPNIGAKSNSRTKSQNLNKEVSLSTPSTVTEKAIKEFRQHIEKSSENVGSKFATEARKMHLGEAPERSIYGESTIKEAKDLIDEGISVVPLPFISSRKTN